MKTVKRFTIWLNSVLLFIFCCAGFYLLYLKDSNYSESAWLVFNMLLLLFAVFSMTSIAIIIYAAFFLDYKNEDLPPGISRMALLSEYKTKEKEFLLTDKISALIGKGDNAYIDLSNSEQSHLIGLEHAAVNRVGHNWFIECVSDEYSVGLRRSGSKFVYKLKTGVCYKLYTNDVVYIACERLLVE